MLNYPLTLSFKLIAFSPQVRVTDASGQLVLYVKQKALALREDVRIFADEAQTQQLYQLNANKIIDFSATYNISIPGGGQIGAVKRQGMRSIWKASYTILDAAGAELGVIHEENPWLKVAESFLADIPFIGMLINPGYLVDMRGQNVLYLKKQPAVFEGKFTIDKRGQFSEAEERVLLSSVIMTMMLERSRG
ncbi:MAG: hypothetical protein JNL73_07190 [Anaerolineales bacterium]|nr:hypothetical protein [Anaerolineales bacterium]